MNSDSALLFSNHAPFLICRNCGAALKAALAHQTASQVLKDSLESFEQGEDAHLPTEEQNVKSKEFSHPCSAGLHTVTLSSSLRILIDSSENFNFLRMLV